MKCSDGGRACSTALPIDLGIAPSSLKALS
jgi:hypothetical protein